MLRWHGFQSCLFILGGLLSFAVCLRKVNKAKVDLLEKEKKPKVE